MRVDVLENAEAMSPSLLWERLVAALSRAAKTKCLYATSTKAGIADSFDFHSYTAHYFWKQSGSVFEIILPEDTIKLRRRPGYAPELINVPSDAALVELYLRSAEC